MNEIVEACKGHFNKLNDGLCWMIGASHDIKDPLEDLMQSFAAIMIALAQTLLVDREQLNEAGNNNDAAASQEIFQQAFQCNVWALLAEARLRNGGVYVPFTC